MSVIGPSFPPCADCGDDERTYYHEADGVWTCEEVPDCRERQFDQMAEQLRGAVSRAETAEAEVERLKRELASTEAELRYAAGLDDDDPLGGR
jgi:tRNA C32,U32 (ribose-2'-O)-methylase TrmJ